MTSERTYPAGVTCWVDTEQPDVDAARHFYADLFGWTFTDAIPADVPGTYLIASLDGAVVAAIGPPQGDEQVEWNTYVAVDDADAAASAVQAAGGSVTLQPVDAGPGGRLAACADPRGARFRLWQPRRRLGAQLTNAPGSWNFSDLYAMAIHQLLALERVAVVSSSPDGQRDSRRVEHELVGVHAAIMLRSPDRNGCAIPDGRNSSGIRSDVRRHSM
jgi:predicted enzyme related to lactoylglutathione lyase